MHGSPQLLSLPTLSMQFIVTLGKNAIDDVENDDNNAGASADVDVDGDDDGDVLNLASTTL